LLTLAETLKLALPFTAVWFEGCDEIVMVGGAAVVVVVVPPQVVATTVTDRVFPV
jgi:hypothetical protein